MVSPAQATVEQAKSEAKKLRETTHGKAPQSSTKRPRGQNSVKPKKKKRKYNGTVFQNGVFQFRNDVVPTPSCQPWNRIFAMDRMPACQSDNGGWLHRYPPQGQWITILGFTEKLFICECQNRE